MTKPHMCPPLNKAIRSTITLLLFMCFHPISKAIRSIITLLLFTRFHPISKAIKSIITLLLLTQFYPLFKICKKGIFKASDLTIAEFLAYKPIYPIKQKANKAPSLHR